MSNQQKILFRGFHPCEDGDTTIYVEGKAVKGWWAEGYYCYEPLTKRHIMLVPNEDGILFDFDFVGSNEVIPSTVGQYTGVNDKNGVKIFKNSIVKEHRLCDEQGQYNTYTINFERHMFVAQNINTGNVVSFCTITVQSELEIIGTIFDEPKEAAP